jgi:hypothetical protein
MLKPAIIGGVLGTALAFLSGCAANTALNAQMNANLMRTQADIDQALSDLADMEIADLQWASADAHAKNDIEFYTCWDGLIPIVQGLKAAKQAGGGTLPSMPKGAASGIQVARDVVHGALGGVSLAGTAAGKPSILALINVACSPMVQAILADQARIAVQVGSAMSGVGAAPAALNALKGIGPILKLLPLPVPLG